MKILSGWQLALVASTLVAAVAAASGHAEPPPIDRGTPRYDVEGRLIFPADYREWVFLSAGFDMTYSDAPVAPGDHVFSNVFAPQAAYRAFRATGVWPDKTVLVLENRGGALNREINRSGQFQTETLVGLETHVKDIARFKGGWAFFSFDGEAPADQIPATSSCNVCHQTHAASDTTFVQFYPTLLPSARRSQTLDPTYRAANTVADTQ